MTREAEKLDVVRRLVIVFDICSSTAILEDLKRTDNFSRWRNLLIHLKKELCNIADENGMEIYKFIGDGWILLLPPRLSKRLVCKFLDDISHCYADRFDTTIRLVLEQRPPTEGLTFGIGRGDLIRITMNHRTEYLGRPINVAARLQAGVKALPGAPSYRALFSLAAFNALPGTAVAGEEVTIPARNIIGGESYSCFLYQAKAT